MSDRMSDRPTPIAEFIALDDEALQREVLGAYRPAVLRGLVKHWPAVQHGRKSPQAIAAYLSAQDSGRPVNAVMTRPEENGRIFYNAAMDGFNFVRNQVPLSKVIEQVLRYGSFDKAPAVAAQSAVIAECLPAFVADNPLPLFDQVAPPRIWLGSAITTPAHFDESNNIACVVAGQRRFTLFPPEQIGNLYIGPLDHAPTGTPISMVSFAQPDFKRFPKFREALAHAFVADLEPGDAIFIPALWWHHVESLQRFNVLVNYWWKGVLQPGRTPPPSAFGCLMHTLVSLKQLSPDERRAWGAIFDHYVFNPEADSTGHIPPERRGILGELTPQQVAQVRAALLAQVR